MVSRSWAPLQPSGRLLWITFHWSTRAIGLSINSMQMAKVETKRGLSEERLREFLREMLLIRRFEEKVEERFRAGELPGFLHVAIGQEAVAVGGCQGLEENDAIASTHRAHGHTLANGTTANELM